MCLVFSSIVYLTSNDQNSVEIMDSMTICSCYVSTEISNGIAQFVRFFQFKLTLVSDLKQKISLFISIHVRLKNYCLHSSSIKFINNVIGDTVKKKMLFFYFFILLIKFFAFDEQL